MFNVTVIRLKDLIKYPIIIVIMMMMIYCTTRYFFKDKGVEKEKINLGNLIQANFNKYIFYPIKIELPIVEEVNKTNKTDSINKEKLIDENNDEADKEFTSYMLETAFKLQLGIVDAKELSNTNDTNKQIDKNEEQQEDNKEDTEVENSELKLASNNETSEVVTKNPIKETYTYKYQGVKIRNETDYELKDDILNYKNLDINNKDILIFHTHTCESYTQSDNYKYKASGNFRTTDLNYSVARVGEELDNYLSKYKFNVIHNKTYHDYPAYSGSYNRSLSTVENILKKNKSDIIIDLHRDAIGSNSSYAPTVKIGDDYCAQLMFVIRDQSEEG